MLYRAQSVNYLEDNHMVLLHVKSSVYIPVKIIATLNDFEALIQVPIDQAWAEKTLEGWAHCEIAGFTVRLWRVQAHRLLSVDD